MKRSFGGQMTLTVCLLFLMLIILSTAAQVLYRRLTVDMLSEDVCASASSAADMTVFFGTDDSKERQQQLCIQLNFTARASGNDTVVCDESGSIVACSCGPQACEHLGYQFDHELLDSASADGPVFRKNLEVGCYGEKRMVAISLAKSKAGTVNYVVSSRSSAAVTERLGEATRLNVFVVLTVLALAIPLVWFITQRQMKPIKQMTAAARRMAHGQMDVRVNVDDTDTTELSELAVAFNNMAQSIAQSERKRQEFVANVSHELKTPMTTISGYMDGMMDGTIPPEQRQKYMEIISGEVKG